MKRRLVISCQWCKAPSRADSYEDLRRVYERHLRNCGALHRMFVAGRFATGAPFTKEQVVDGILQRSGLHPEGQRIKAETELKALRQQISADPELGEEERAELLASIDKEIGTPTHEATGKAVALALEEVEVDVTPAARMAGPSEIFHQDGPMEELAAAARARAEALPPGVFDTGHGSLGARITSISDGPPKVKTVEVNGTTVVLLGDQRDLVTQLAAAGATAANDGERAEEHNRKLIVDLFGKETPS